VSSAGTGYIYPTTKNPTNVVHKLALMKVRGWAPRALRARGGIAAARAPLIASQYDPVVHQHVLFTEAKMPKSKGGRRAGK